MAAERGSSRERAKFSSARLAMCSAMSRLLPRGGAASPACTPSSRKAPGDGTGTTAVPGSGFCVDCEHPTPNRFVHGGCDSGTASWAGLGAAGGGGWMRRDGGGGGLLAQPMPRKLVQVGEAGVTSSLDVESGCVWTAWTPPTVTDRLVDTCGVATGAGATNWKPPIEMAGRVSGVGVGSPGAGIGAGGGAGRIVPVAKAVLSSINTARPATVEPQIDGL